MRSALTSPPHEGPSRRDGHPGIPTDRRAEPGARQHRFDIDGMRGVAVLSLLAVHVFPQWINGGFIGVDIFFVLSGYLVSDSLLRAHDTGTFSLTAFYSRRIQRIVPSLSVVLLSVLAFSVLFTYPDAARQVGMDVFTGSTFISNITLWHESVQRGLAVTSRPLMHLWWLGVEAQFCLLWPMLLMLLLRFRQVAAPVIALLTLGSVVLCVSVVDSPASVHLLMPFTRWWELMAGALLAGLMRRDGAGPVAALQARLGKDSAGADSLPDAISFSGMALLLMAALMFDEDGGTPAWWGILPTTGTFALLAAGPQAWVNRVVLSQPILRFYGAISYPLYLWHWPMLCFPAVIGMPLTQELRIIILTASVVLAALTHELAEKPYRSRPHRKGLPMALLAVLMAVGALGLVVQHTYGLQSTFPEAMRSGPTLQFR